MDISGWLEDLGNDADRLTVALITVEPTGSGRSWMKDPWQVIFARIRARGFVNRGRQDKSGFTAIALDSGFSRWADVRENPDSCFA